jgi:putative intracellular protease/amidase
MPTTKTIGFVFIQGFADWEYGLLSGSAIEWFGARTVALGPDDGEAVSLSGFRLRPERSINPAENEDLDAVAVVGSDQWAGSGAPDPSPLLDAGASRGGVVGGICAGTLALARAGLFAEANHTSNGRAWILHHEPNYAGKAYYQDVPHAVADGRIVSAPGSASGTFALEFLAKLYPDQPTQIAEIRKLFASEYRPAS